MVRLANECEGVFVETSAKDGSGVDEALGSLTSMMRANEDMQVKCPAFHSKASKTSKSQKANVVEY